MSKKDFIDNCHEIAEPNEHFNDEEPQILESFSKKFLENMEDLDNEKGDLINKNFWDLF